MVPSTHTQRNSQRRSNTCRAHDRTLCIMTRQLSAIPCITPPVSSPPWARGRTIDKVQYPHAPPSHPLLSHCCATDAAPLTTPQSPTLRNLRCMHTPVLAPHARPGQHGNPIHPSDTDPCSHPYTASFRVSSGYIHAAHTPQPNNTTLRNTTHPYPLPKGCIDPPSTPPPALFRPAAAACRLAPLFLCISSHNVPVYPTTVHIYRPRCHGGDQRQGEGDLEAKTGWCAPTSRMARLPTHSGICSTGDTF